MALDQDYQRHLQGWLGFARLMRWAVVAIIVVLLFLAYMTL
ncbi:MAG TPA: aa3-type cytochrome c oxidase subunit IV [Stellaceae bacterium]|nr:aa3-type cytochrome c oxidase subunit IV [Stellaceae bacterium]